MEISRRNFLMGAGAVAGAAAVAGLAGCSSESSAAESSDTESSDSEDSSSTETETVDHDPSSTESFDVVVVGSGTAGTCAALRAAQEGLSVVCLEKNSMLGGTSTFAEGFCGIGSDYQAENGIEVNPTDVLVDTMKYHHYACSGPVVRTFVDNCGETINWLTDQGVQWSAVTFLGDSYPVWHLPADEEGNATHVETVLELLQPEAEDEGVEFRTSTPMTDLAVTDGKVTGVYIGSGSDEVLIEAKAVILASGGYASNPDMFEEFTGRPYDSVRVWGMEGRDGDGIARATAVAGADTHIPSAVMYHTGCLEGTDAFSDIPNFVLTMQPTMRVNAVAERYFDESCVSDFTSCGNVLTTNTPNYVIFDDGYIDYIEENGPFNPMPNLGAFVGEPFECREGITSCEGVVQGDTLDEVAEGLGLDADALAATVERYNGFCDSGVDEDYGKPAEMLLSISKAPYYGALITPTLFTTVGGLRVNEHMQVLDMEGEPIEGLFAAGGDAGGLYGANYDVDVCSGGQQGWAATSGRLASEYIAENIA